MTVGLTLLEMQSALEYLFDSNLVKRNSGREVINDYLPDDLAAEEENVKKEKAISREIFNHFSETEFASIAYFFEKIPQPNLDYLNLTMTKEQTDFEKQQQICNLF
jgi:hypothetical protein